MKRLVWGIVILAIVALIGIQFTSADAVKLEICHHPGGQDEEPMTLSIGDPAVANHVNNHGDSLGPCPE